MIGKLGRNLGKISVDTVNKGLASDSSKLRMVSFPALLEAGRTVMRIVMLVDGVEVR